uniref:Ninjurin-1 n=1 Tax=Jaculus jaculus TaxID=51337 RepID=A0A8C5KRQ2_JACJA
MESSGTEEYELNGDLNPGSPEASLVAGLAEVPACSWQLIRSTGLTDLWLIGPKHPWAHPTIYMPCHYKRTPDACAPLCIRLTWDLGNRASQHAPQIRVSSAIQAAVGTIHSFSPTVKYDLNNPAKHAKLDFLNNLATGLVFIIVVVNIFITAFGVQKPVMDTAPRQ